MPTIAMRINITLLIAQQLWETLLVAVLMDASLQEALQVIDLLARKDKGSTIHQVDAI